MIGVSMRVTPIRFMSGLPEMPRQSTSQLPLPPKGGRGRRRASAVGEGVSQGLDVSLCGIVQKNAVLARGDRLRWARSGDRFVRRSLTRLAARAALSTLGGEGLGLFQVA